MSFDRPDTPEQHRPEFKSQLSITAFAYDKSYILLKPDCPHL